MRPVCIINVTQHPEISISIAPPHGRSCFDKWILCQTKGSMQSHLPLFPNCLRHHTVHLVQGIAEDAGVIGLWEAIRMVLPCSFSFKQLLHLRHAALVRPFMGSSRIRKLRVLHHSLG